MSIYPNITEQDIVYLAKLAEQKENKRAINYRNKILKQTHEKKNQRKALNLQLKK